MGNKTSKKSSKVKTFSSFLKKYPSGEYYEFEFEAKWTYCFREGSVHMYNIENEQMFYRVKKDPIYVLFDNLSIVQIPEYVLGKFNLSTSYNKVQKVIVPKSHVGKYTSYLDQNNISSKSVYCISLNKFIQDSHLFNNK